MGNNSNFSNRNNNERHSNGGYNNGFTKRPQKREKVKPVTLENTFLDFEEGISELAGIVNVVDDIIKGHPSLKDSSVELTEKLVKEAIIMDIADNVPIYGNRGTQFYSLTTSFLKTFYKTAKFIGFGWDAVRSQDKKYIDAYTFKVTLYSNREEFTAIKQRLEAVGYEVVESTSRH